MSTQLGFDFAGLVAAVERGDVDCQLALYAADAEVRVACSGATGSVSVYRGKDAIRAWLQQPELEHVSHRLGNLTPTEEGILLTDVIRLPDGRNMIYQTTLRLEEGQITDQDTTLIWEDPQA